MTKEQVQVFEELLSSADFQGKKQLRHVLWLNTVKPKFKVGQCFIVSERGHKILGHPVRDFNARIVKISSYINEEQWFYELEVEVRAGDKTVISSVHQTEDELCQAMPCDTNITILE